MTSADLLRFSFGAVRANRTRALLSALSIAVGIAAVVLLTAIGEGVHQYVLAQFTQFGTNLIGVTPGKTKTAGASVGVFGSVRPLTIADAQAIHRLPSIRVADPIVTGNAEIKVGRLTRRVTIYGVGGDFPQALQIKVAYGSFLPKDDPFAARPLAALGAKVENELFGGDSPLGHRIDVAGFNYTIVGVMEKKGQIFGVDLDDVVYVPVASAMELFNREGLMEIHVTYDPQLPSEEVEQQIWQVLRDRHGREDFTITSQRESLSALDSILSVLTLAVAGLGAVSVIVGAVAVLTVTIIGIQERVSEVGLLSALGATKQDVSLIFILEAALICFLGGLGGITVGLGIAYLIKLLSNELPVYPVWTFVVIAEAAAIVIGIMASVFPARYAASLDPVDALRTE